MEVILDCRSTVGSGDFSPNSGGFTGNCVLDTAAQLIKIMTVFFLIQKWKFCHLLYIMLLQMILSSVEHKDILKNVSTVFVHTIEVNVVYQFQAPKRT